MDETIRILVKGNWTLAAIDRCRMIIADILVKVLENVYETNNASKVTRIVEVWSLEEICKEKDRIHAKFSKKNVSRMSGCAANQVLKLKLGRHRKRRKVRHRLAKYWLLCYTQKSRA
jgi:hypothetical protein